MVVLVVLLRGKGDLIVVFVCVTELEREERTVLGWKDVVLIRRCLSSFLPPLIMNRSVAVMS